MISLHQWIIILALICIGANAIAKNLPSDCNDPSELEKQANNLMQVAVNLPPPGGCADASKLAIICDAIYKKWDGPRDTEYDYMYEKFIHDAACVKPSDSDDVISSKVRYMWKKLEDPHLKCDTANFDVARGNVLKYALKMDNYDFLSLAVEVWKVNINSIDKNDNRTLLDYLQKEIDRTKGTRYEVPLRDYYIFLRKNGAKLRSELY